jgi:hypothetical protein
MPGQIYGYRVEGPSDPARGMRFDPSKLLLDPTAMKSVVVDPSSYDWEGDVPPGRPSSRTIVYEMHVRGFTRHPNSDVAEDKRGTYAGLIEKIPGGPDGPQWLAPLDRHVSGIPARHRPVAGSIHPARPNLPGRGALGRGPVCRSHREESAMTHSLRLVLLGTPVDLRRNLNVSQPVARERYELEEVTPGGLRHTPMRENRSAVS